MSRGLVPGLASAHPLGELLPALYLDDDFAQRFCAGLDEVVAPVMATLDSSDAYVDARLTPLDFLASLAGWVGVELEAAWPEARRRQVVAEAAEVFGWYGTVRGVARVVELTFGVRPEVVEGPHFDLLVRLRVPDPELVDTERLDRLVARTKPAHVVHRVEVVLS